MPPHSLPTPDKALSCSDGGVGCAAALAAAVDGELRPAEVCKVDHYLGKEAVNVIGSFRHANAEAYEPLLNKDFVESIEVVMTETEDCEGRSQPHTSLLRAVWLTYLWHKADRSAVCLGAAGFYERYGAVRDVLQNHLSVMLALATGELKDDGSGGVDRTGLLRDVTPPQSAEFGQYEGYQEHVAADGVIDPAKGERAGAPTAAVVRLAIDSERWRGVPVTMRVGKAADKREAYLRFVFKEGALGGAEGGAELRFQVQGGKTGGMQGLGEFYNQDTFVAGSVELPEPEWPTGWCVSAALPPSSSAAR